MEVVMTNAELFEALKIAENRYGYWSEQEHKIFPPADASDNAEYWYERVFKLRIEFNKRLKKL